MSTSKPNTSLEYVFVIAYGRSGSTLVQGLLNTLPGTLVRGENNLYVLPMFHAQQLARQFKRKYGKNSRVPSSAFYGLGALDIDSFAAATNDVVVSHLLADVDASGISRVGFKEVLWHRIRPRETEGFFRFFDAAFPNARYVLNQRDHEQVLGSGFWQKQDEASGRRSLERVEAIQAHLRETRPDRVYDVRYEVLTGEDAAATDTMLRGLAQFVTGSCDDALLAALRETMTRGHGPNPFGASRGRRKSS